MLADVLDKFISNGIDGLSMSDVVRETSYRPDSVETFAIFKDNSFNKKKIGVSMTKSCVIIADVFTSKECEKILSLNCKKLKKINDDINECLIKSKKLASMLLDRIYNIVKYNSDLKTLSVSNKFVLSEFTNEPYYHVAKGEACVYIFLNSGFSDGNIYVKGSKYKPMTGSILITNEVCKGEKVKDGYQYVIQGSFI